VDITFDGDFENDTHIDGFFVDGFFESDKSDKSDKSENQLEHQLNNDVSSSEISIYDTTKVTCYSEDYNKHDDVDCYVDDTFYDSYEAGCDLGEIHDLDEAMVDNIGHINLDHDTSDNADDGTKESEASLEHFFTFLSPIIFFYLKFHKNMKNPLI
jgi:hypothetical protein